uniref:Proline dehydrogenase n=1 Tax=Timema californicum TaxID=61474 RepID=A0A7R9PA37_TIMCA|nr:unnamed protein product [Timema californicum]
MVWIISLKLGLRLLLAPHNHHIISSGFGSHTYIVSQPQKVVTYPPLPMDLSYMLHFSGICHGAGSQLSWRESSLLTGVYAVKQLGQLFLGDRVLGWVLRPTLYKQFVAGTAIEDLAATTISLRAVGLRLMVAPTLEEDVDETCCSQTKYENNLKELLRLADMAHTCGGKVAISKDVHLLVDAEYSYVNSGCSIITLAMMAHFNQHSPLVANTFQCYFKDSWKNLNDEINISQQLGACFAAKIVRGAYLEKERCISPENVCTSHACTGENYNKTLEVGLHHAVTAGSKRTLIIIATHNENSVISALQSLQDMGISRRDGHVVFAQIYGMGEQISMPLAHAGYIVYKSVPMGPLNQVLPYLARRVAENRSVLQGARKERELLQQELKHRMLEKLHVVNMK